MKEKLRLLPLALLPVFLAIIAFVLLKYESDYLWKAQELNLFLDTPLFLRQQTAVSGWLLTWLGTYFTQYFYHPWQGVTLLCLWWALLMFVTARAFRIPAKWSLVLLIPVAALLLSDVGLGYWLYYIKMRGHLFAGTIGTTMAVSSVWLFRMLPKRYFLHTIYLAVSSAVLYPLIGAYALLATLLAGIIIWREPTGRTEKVATSATALAATLLWPLVYYRYVFCQTNIQDIYWTGLPRFVIDKPYSEYYLPYIVLAGFLLVLAVCYRQERETVVRRPLVWGLTQLVLLAAIVVGVSHFWYTDYNFHKELKMQRCLEEQNWEGITSEATFLDDEPTRAMVVMKNLALFRQGTQGNTMYHYRTGAKACNAPFPVTMAQVVGVPLYYHYGLCNFSYRWCVEFSVELGWRVEYLKYLTRCSIVNGEYMLARKYLNLLRHTRFHREWADRYARFLDNEKAIRAEAEFTPILHLATCDDRLTSDETVVEKFIMNHFARYVGNDPLCQELSVYAALWTKDIGTFWRRFFPYAESHVGKPMPIHIQEAAYLYGHLEHGVDISNMPFDPSVVKSYEELMQTAQQYAHLGEEAMAQALYPRFGHTFYYDYYFVRNQKLY